MKLYAHISDPLANKCIILFKKIKQNKLVSLLL